MDKELLKEKLADIEHQRWSDWQSYCHKILRENCPSPELEKVLERWDRQIATPYAELSEKEKESDREQVERYWPLIEQELPKKIAPWNDPTIIWVCEDHPTKEQSHKVGFFLRECGGAGMPKPEEKKHG